MKAEVIRVNSKKRRLVIDEAVHSDVFKKKHFLVVVCSSAASVSTTIGLAGLFIPISGQTALSATSWHVVAERGSIYASDSQRSLVAHTDEHSSCIAILARQDTWSSVLDPWTNSPSQPYAVLPGFHQAPQHVRRRLFRFVREAISGSESSHLNFSQLASSLSELQSKFDELIQRCPGVSLAAKRAVFLRIQRSANQISFREKDPPSVSEMARTANYSTQQFIRVFSGIFGRTPYDYMSQIRAERARELLREGKLSVSDVATVLGIDNRATFGRMMRKRLGQPASLIRRQARES
jgi:AraC family transcriptional regulator